MTAHSVDHGGGHDVRGVGLFAAGVAGGEYYISLFPAASPAVHGGEAIRGKLRIVPDAFECGRLDDGRMKSGDPLTMTVTLTHS